MPRYTFPATVAIEADDYDTALEALTWWCNGEPVAVNDAALMCVLPDDTEEEA